MARGLVVRVTILACLAVLLCTPTVCAQRSSDMEGIDDYIGQIQTVFDPDVIRAIAWVESCWHQFGPGGKTFVDGSMCQSTGKISIDYGIMQINEKTIKSYGLTKKQIARIMNDTNYNICIGVSILECKLIWIRKLKKKSCWKRVEEKCSLKGLSDEDIAIIAYNGLRANHVYLRLVRKAMRDKPWLKCMGDCKAREQRRLMRKGGSAHEVQVGERRGKDADKGIPRGRRVRSVCVPSGAPGDRGNGKSLSTGGSGSRFAKSSLCSDSPSVGIVKRRSSGSDGHHRQRIYRGIDGDHRKPVRKPDNSRTRHEDCTIGPSSDDRRRIFIRRGASRKPRT